VNLLRQGFSILCFKIVLVCLIALFLIVYLKNIDYKYLFSLQLSLYPLTIAACLSVASRYWGVLVWQFILVDLGAQNLPGFIALANIHAKAWIARYLPGTVTWMIGKVYFARNLGVSKSRLSASTIIEAGVQIVAVATTSIIFLLLDGRLFKFTGIFPLILLLISLCMIMSILLIPSVFDKVSKYIFKLLGLKPLNIEFSINGKATLRSYGLYAIGSIISGLSYYYIVLSVWPSLPINDLIFIVAAVNLAGVAGTVTPLLPGGIGVRDATFLVLLSQIMPKEVAFAVTVFSRLWSIVIDILFYLVSRIQFSPDFRISR